MIIDASVGVKWFVPEDDADKALALLLSDDLCVPRLFLSEISNALWKKARLGEIDLALVEPVASVEQVANYIDDAEHIGRALIIARELDHPVYDCLYLAAAEALDMKLVTADARFLRKVKGTAFQAHVQALADCGVLP